MSYSDTRLARTIMVTFERARTLTDILAIAVDMPDGWTVELDYMDDSERLCIGASESAGGYLTHEAGAFKFYPFSGGEDQDGCLGLLAEIANAVACLAEVTV
jgi:hypothetical protein